MIDFHAHILPGADHGSDGVETSLYQLEQASSIGITDIVATPHFYPHRHNVKQFLERREKARRRLLEAGTRDIRVYCGAEVLICGGLESMPGIEKLCIAGTNVLLAEMPFHRLESDILETIYSLQHDRGFTVVLAHVDRYEADDVRQVMETGALAQVNAEAVCGLRSRFTWLDWAKQGAISALGSDIHMQEKHYQKLAKARKILKHFVPEINAQMQNLLQNATEISALGAWELPRQDETVKESQT